jgi:hypothetical protein
VVNVIDNPGLPNLSELSKKYITLSHYYGEVGALFRHKRVLDAPFTPPLKRWV